MFWFLAAMMLLTDGWAVVSQTALPQEPSLVDASEEIRWQQTANLAIWGLKNEGGCTIDLKTATALAAVDAWAVSLEGAEWSLDKQPSRDDIIGYLWRHARVFRNAGNVYLGCWYDSSVKGGRWVLDVTVLIRDRQEAETFGRANHQRCIFHLQLKQEVRL